MKKELTKQEIGKILDNYLIYMSPSNDNEFWKNFDKERYKEGVINKLLGKEKKPLFSETSFETGRTALRCKRIAEAALLKERFPDYDFIHEWGELKEDTCFGFTINEKKLVWGFSKEGWYKNKGYQIFDFNDFDWR